MDSSGVCDGGLMPSVSVSNLELYRTWRDCEDLDLQWLLRRLRGEEPQTEAMAAGEALHSALENASEGEESMLESGEFKFYFKADIELSLSPIRELKLEKQYGGLTVRGRVDDLNGKTVTDYKSTASFDADRMWEGFQWRYYLDMADCDTFIWKVFVMTPLLHREYSVIQYHELKQHRYEKLHEECEKLATDFLQFARDLESSNIPWTRSAVLSWS